MEVIMYQTLSTLTISALSNYAPTVFENYIAVIITIFCVLVLGLPHGALDEVLYYEVDSIRRELPRKPSWIPILSFFANYLSIMAFWGLLWWCVPTFAFWSFLTLSSYHFGEGELDYVDCITNIFRPILYLSRGFMIVGLTLTSKPDITLPIVRHLIDIDQDTFTSLCSNLLPICMIQHVICLMCLATAIFNPAERIGKITDFPIKKVGFTKSHCLFELFKCAIYRDLFLHTSPLVSFAVFFGIWHSFSTILADIRYLKRNQRLEFSNSTKITFNDIILFYRYAFPYTAIAFSSMLTVYFSWSLLIQQFALETSRVWAVFICCISIITAPHMWIIGALHWKWISLDPLKITTFFSGEPVTKTARIDSGIDIE